MGNLKYYPLTRAVTNLYTRGTEYATEDGKPYSGRYYRLFNGELFTGVNPVTGTNLKLYPISSFNSTRRNGNFNPTLNTLAYTNLQAGNTPTDLQGALDDGALTELKPYYPIPIESDYQRGYFMRYFAKTVSGPGFVFEISPTDWTKIQNGDIAAENILGYESIDMLWQLTGPLNDTRISQYQIKGGIASTNKRVTEAKNKVFNGLLEFIGGDYIKFARITP